VMWLMLVGNVGIVTAVASLMLSALDVGGLGHEGPCPYWRSELAVLFGGMALLLLLASSRWVDRHLSRLIRWALRRFTRIDARDYANLLHLRDDYGIAELHVDSGDWIAGKTLGESRLAREGVLVLGVECPGGSFLGAPGNATELRPGDRLVLYGRNESVCALDQRVADTAGDDAHAEAVRGQTQVSREEHARAGR